MTERPHSRWRGKSIPPLTLRDVDRAAYNAGVAELEAELCEALGLTPLPRTGGSAVLIGRAADGAIVKVAQRADPILTYARWCMGVGYRPPCALLVQAVGQLPDGDGVYKIRMEQLEPIPPSAALEEFSRVLMLKRWDGGIPAGAFDAAAKAVIDLYRFAPCSVLTMPMLVNWMAGLGLRARLDFGQGNLMRRFGSRDLVALDPVG